jgi:hypothetical protein
MVAIAFRALLGGYAERRNENVDDDQSIGRAMPCVYSDQPQILRLPPNPSIICPSAQLSAIAQCCSPPDVLTYAFKYCCKQYQGLDNPALDKKADIDHH